MSFSNPIVADWLKNNFYRFTLQTTPSEIEEETYQIFGKNNDFCQGTMPAESRI